ncbi:hypothetical protein [Kutzneria sp. NPDC052558]|uniref:hypothetical protein n=1 Tax=Kutzneria sp. NPDC052558 TaxID=3364121 RepID=UPI0037C769DC
MSDDEFALDVRLGPPLATWPGDPSPGTEAQAAITITQTSDRCAARLSITVFG